MGTYKVYVLYSKDFNKIYIGYSSDVDNRLSSHNDPGNKGWTRSFRPWVIVYTEEFDTRASAMKREKELKTSRGREFIWNSVIAQLPA
ncbi:MAG: GIY-YIG nuclease family protein [Bacteroidota bacterium]